MIEHLVDVDLSTGVVLVLDIPSELIRDYVGGLGLAVKYVCDAVSPGIDPLSPENIVTIATGPLSGTVAPTNGRTAVATISPLNGLLGIGNFGGWWGPRLHMAGFLAVRIMGMAATPVYLLIDDDRAELRDASHLWGRDAWETTDLLKREHGDDFSVLSIGQAGENRVKFACPVSDYSHSPSRSTAGGVLGAKRLKAIIVRGTKKVPVANPTAFRHIAKECAERIIERAAPPNGSKAPVGSFYLMVQKSVDCGLLQSKNYQTTGIPQDSDILRTSEIVQAYLTEGSFGYHCLLEKYFGCQVVAEVETGPYAGTKVGGYCYHPTWGTACQIRSYPAMWKCQELCQRYGMDAPGIPIPFAMELYQRGLLTEEQCDGLDLTWGNEAATIDLIHKTAFREGFGDLMAEGGQHLAKVVGNGAEKYSMTTKGVELMAFEPRGGPLKSVLGLMINPRGGDDALTTRDVSLEMLCGWAKEAGWSDEQCVEWLLDYLDMSDEAKRQIFGSPSEAARLGEHNPEGKAAEAAWQSKVTPLFNSLGLCLYSANYYWALGPIRYAKLMTARSGEPVTADQLIAAGERTCNLMRVFLVRAGIRRADDDIPDRFYDEPVDGGLHDGATISRETMQHLLTEYYEHMGWDPATGIPTRAKLLELGLAAPADQLETLTAPTDA